MSTTVNLAGTTYSIPNEGDGGYAQDLTAYFVALANNTKVFQTSSANFPLQQETNFGASYGLKVAYIKSQATNPSGTGIVRLGNNEGIGWRNSTNTSDLALKVNSSDVLEFNGTSISIGGSPVQTAITVSDTATIDLTLSSNNVSGIVIAGSLDDSHIKALAAIAYSKLNLSNSILNSDIATGAAIAHSKMAALTASRALISDVSGVVSASSISSAELGFLSGVTSSIQTQLNTNVSGLVDHLNDSNDAHDASAISNIPTGNLAATDVQGALNELQTDIDTRATSAAFSAHTGASTGVHGVTGSVVGTTDTQTLSNKTLSAPVINSPVVDVMTLDGQASTPATPSAGNYKAYVKDSTKKLTILNSDGVETTVGTGSGSVNFISNGDIEAGTIGFSTYSDSPDARPVDGTGGIASLVTISASSTNPLTGTNSLLVSKAAGDARGQGVSYDFTIDSASQAKVLKISFDYAVATGTFVAGTSTTDSDVIVYLYDITNARLIEPSSIKLLSNATSPSDTFQSTFQTSPDSVNYRLIFHIASSAGAPWGLKIDNVKVERSQYVYGTPITDWASVAASFGVDTGSLGTSTTTCFRRRVGDSYEYSARLAFTGAAGTWTGLYFQLPSGDAIDTTKLTAGFRGTARFNDLGVSEYSGFLRQRNSSSFFIFPNAVVTHTGTAPVVTTQNSNTFPFSMASGDEIVVNVEVPIVGLSSSVQVSDGYAARPIAGAAYRVNTTQTGVNPNNSQVKIQINGLGVNNLDTVSGFDFTNNRYVVKTAGIYDIDAAIHVSGTNVVVADYILRVVVNGVTTYNLDAFVPQASTGFVVKGSLSLPLNAGDYVEVFLFSTANHSTNTLTIQTGNSTRLLISKQQAPTTISMTETVAVIATNASGQSIPNNAGTAITGWTEQLDTHNAFNATTGIFTAPYPGFYCFAGNIVLASHAGTVGSQLALTVSGSIAGGRTLGRFYTETTSSMNRAVGGTAIIYLTGGETAQINAFQSSGSSKNLIASASENTINIFMVK